MTTKKALAVFSRDLAFTRLNETLQLAQKAEKDCTVRTLFEIRGRMLDAHYEEFVSAHQKLITLLDVEEYASANEKCTQADEAFFTSSAVYSELFQAPRKDSPQDTPNNGSTHNITNSFNNVKLPKLTIPHFDGNLKQWQTFRDMFKSLIHDNETLSNVEKFQYLISSLAGVPLGIVSSLPINNDNYLVAYKLLNDRYQNKRLLAVEHWRAIQGAHIATSDSPESLQKIVDIFSKNLAALELLGFDTKSWDFILLNLLIDKLDLETKKEFEREFTKIELPTYEQLKTFVLEYSTALCRVKKSVSSRVVSNNSGVKNIANQRVTKAHTAILSENNCPICNERHYINQCSSFLKLTPKEKHQKIKELKLCNNCFKNHFIKNCTSKFNCKHCGQRHHSLLHFHRVSNSQMVVDSAPCTSNENITTENALTVLTNSTPQAQTLLATVIVKIKDIYGKFQSCRALLDSGSQSNFVTESFVKKLGLNKSPIHFAVQGISQASLNISSKTELNLHSQYIEFSCNLNCLILPRITSNLPSGSFNVDQLVIPKDVTLADPTFNLSNEIDLLIGASLFWSILLSGRKSFGKNNLILQETKLGWIISGQIPITVSSFLSTCLMEVDSVSDNSLTRFWQIEEPQLAEPRMSLEEKECERHFLDTYKRNQLGRFIVSIPFNNRLSQLGESKHFALRRFLHLENKLDKVPNLKEQYVNFMSEYIKLGHMSEVISESECGYYIPHHAIFKESISTRLRVVFDASMKTNTGISLNETQLVGPVVQNDLLSIVLRFRQYQFVLTGDVKMMYRQILVNPDQRKFQKIFWRSSPLDSLKVFTLNTVTYGTASAPYLATRCLKQLSNDLQTSNPLVANIIANDFYVDDLITGSDSIDSLIQIRKDISSTLNSAGFELRKFMSNNELVLENLSCDIDLQVLNFGTHENYKTLGVLWNSNKDHIQFEIGDVTSMSIKPTKRNILSTISSIFDPLGLVSPVIVNAKLLIQALWEQKLGWDDVIPQNLQTSWYELRDSLHCLNTIRIPRYAILKNSIRIELHGFCDSSERAYGACIYLRSFDSFNNLSSNLLISKSKVAPLRKLTLPRLELCGAQLLSVLLKKVLNSMPQLNITHKYYWCDSKIALSWIKSSPNKWKTFVGNRVASIQENTSVNEWFYVESLKNPADIVSRGATPSALINSTLWWHGPSFLLDPYFKVQNQSENLNNIDNTLELRNIKVCCTAIVSSQITESEIFAKFSDYNKLIRVLGIILRWKNRCKNKLKIFGPLTIKEINEATITIVKLAQSNSFQKEIHALKNHGKLNSNSNILSLHPFLDTDGILRVGGRLQNSSFPVDVKHPIILSHKHILTSLIMRFKHVKALHCGPQALLYTVRQQFWPTNGRNLANKIVRSCVHCFRIKPAMDSMPIMGNLPSTRTEQNSVFKNVGIDYAGPFSIKTHKLRGFKIIKCYIALFVCMSTKALHLELVSDLTTDAFIATFRRFIGRRGKPLVVYSDNGTNFVGADREIKRLNEFLKSKQLHNTIANTFNVDNIEWKFIPSRSPTFGGLWEAGVRSVKFHLRRVLKTSQVTFEEFYTILVQIEAIVNSRPLSPLSSDPNDYQPLTPGHFLIGRPLTQIPDGEYIEQPANRIKHFHYLQQVMNHFWSRWSREYINNLQTRQKWKQNNQTLLQIGRLVLLKDENLPPMRWKLGRLEELHRGNDDVVRVATVKTENGVVTRAVSKLCLLPIE